MYFHLTKKALPFLFPFFLSRANATVAELHIDSSDFSTYSCSSIEQKSFLPDKSFGAACGSSNQQPYFSWSGAPYDTGSYAITITDVSRDDGVILPHLLAWDVPENVSQISSSTDLTALGATLGNNGKYSGPCPVSRSSCIRLSLYAIADKNLGLPVGATYEQLYKKLLETADGNGLLDAAVVYTVAEPRQPDNIRTGA